MSLIERAIAIVSPRWAWERQQYAEHLRISAAYHAADPRISTPVPFQPARGTANQTLVPALSWLISRSRDLQRNHPAACAAVEARVAHVVGRGLSVTPDSGVPALDEILEEGWECWADGAFIDGTDLNEGQRIAYRAWVSDGGFLWRWVADPDRATIGEIPDRLMQLDVDWLSETPISKCDEDCTFVAGIEYDKFNRPRWFHLVNPDRGNFTGQMGMGTGLANALASTLTAGGERVPADQIIHGFRTKRAGQGRGEPELSPSVLWLWNGHSLIEAELKAAVVGSSPALLVKTRQGPNLIAAMGNAAAKQEGRPTTGAGSLPALNAVLPSGGVAGLYPDEDIVSVENKRPSQQIMPFLKSIWGVVAASLRIGRRMIDRDYADANYSSLRADQLDTRRHLEPEQDCFGRFVVTVPYRRIAPLIAAINRRPFPADAVRRARLLRHEVMPDGWPYVDPEKDIRAATNAIAAGLSTWTDEVSKRGGNLRRLWKQLAKDRALAKDYGLVLDLSGSNAPAPDSTVTSDPAKDPTDPADAVPTKDSTDPAAADPAAADPGAPVPVQEDT